MLASPSLADDKPGAASVSVVNGVAADDLLNVRDSASAFGKVKGRLPNGTPVKNFGCDVINGYPWCRVEVVGNAQLVGFVPGRYLVPAEGQTRDDALADMADAEKNPPATAAIKPEPDKSPASGSVAAVQSTGKAAPVAPSPAMPADMMARFGGPGLTASAPAATSLGASMHDAYGLAFANRDDTATGGVKAAGADEPIPAASADAKASDAMAQGTPAPGIPIPTPRPDGAAAQPEVVALADPAQQPPISVPAASAPSGAPAAAGIASANPAPAPPFAPPAAARAVAPAAPPAMAANAAADPKTAALPQAPRPDATADIPCARYVGQPMTRCQATAIRKGDAAEVTVYWPDGGTRVISFRDGKPSSANSHGDFRFSREGTLNMIRIGLSERFEITDELPFGG